MPTKPTNVLGRTPRIGLSARFRVEVDGVDLGGWASCKGLSVTFDSEELEVGGNYEHAILLPKRLKYNSITLIRAITPEGTKAVQGWLRSVLDGWVDSYHGDDYTPGTAKITLLDSACKTVVGTWTLRDVYPKSWKGPDLDAESGKIATETLELVHQGFL
ncbi:phage tail protein [Kitasatospora mediocidica]|uniref:phage tail protein n=1 Tax=Kitasatospora mediocidica TaxID=58352 RepID=UPI0006902C91|nr:phage tail protein [Kitasatospora mediocidica]